MKKLPIPLGIWTVFAVVAIVCGTAGGISISLEGFSVSYGIITAAIGLVAAVLWFATTPLSSDVGALAPPPRKSTYVSDAKLARLKEERRQERRKGRFGRKWLGIPLLKRGRMISDDE